MLETATLVRVEEFAWSSSHSCPLVDCGALAGKAISRIRVPVHYTYRLPLAATWTLKRSGDGYLLQVPKEEVKLPPAVELDKMEIQTTRSLLAPSKQHNREMLLRQLQPELARRATLPQYADAHRDQSRKTIAEFAAKWMREQGVTASGATRVQFADEGPGSN